MHTQSSMLQQQMTMNIINEIKMENRLKEKPTAVSNTLRKLQKTFKPLKYFSLFILLVLPIFKMPSWCVAANFYQDPEGEQCEG